MSYQTGNCEAPSEPRVRSKTKHEKKFRVEVRSNPEAALSLIQKALYNKSWRKYGDHARKIDAEHEAEKVNRTYRWLIARVVPLQ